MDIIKIAALLLVVCALAFSLDSSELSGGELPAIGLNVDRIRPYEEYGSVTIGGDDLMRDVGVLVRKRGNSTINAEKMSFSLRFMKNTSIFGMDANDRWILLGVPFDKTLIRTELGFEYARAIGLEGISQTTLCDFYLRGKYHGAYVFLEPVTARGLGLDLHAGDCLLERNLDREVEGRAYVETDGGLRFEIGAEDAGAAQRCLDAINRAERAMAGGEMAEYAQYIDVDSFVNGYIAQEITRHIDFSMFSDRYFFRDGKLYAGPLWDLDLSMGNVTDRIKNEQYLTYNNLEGYGDGSGNSAHGFWAQRDFYAHLCADDEFMALVRARWQEIYPITENLILDNDLGENRIDALVKKYEKAIDRNYERWSLDTRYSDLEYYEIFSTYEEAVGHLRAWLTDRIAWLDAQFSAQDEGGEYGGRRE